MKTVSDVSLNEAAIAAEKEFKIVYTPVLLNSGHL